MKKALPVLLVLAAVAVAGVIYLVKRDKLNPTNPTGRAVDLAPADTVLFFEIPNIERSRVRWTETALHKISQEPEWKAFTAKSQGMITDDAVFRNFSAVLSEVQKVDPAGMFVALTSFEGPSPRLVAGIPCRAPKKDVEPVIEKLKTRILEAWPAAKTDVALHESIEVTSIIDPKFTAAYAYHESWFLFATDTELLQKTLSRYLKRADAPPALSKDPLWDETSKHGSAEPDLRVWARWSVFADKLKAISAMAGPGALATVDEANPAQTVTYTLKLDGPLMRDHLHVHFKNPDPRPPLANKLIAFSNPATYAYLATSLEGIERSVKSSMQTLASLGVPEAVNQVLAPRGLKFDDIFTTFGPEIGLMSSWEPGGLSLPDFFAAAEIKDPAKARLFAELVADQMKGNGEVTATTEGQTSIWTSAAPVPFFKPTVAVNQQHLMFAMNPAALSTAMRQVAEGKPNISTQPGSPFSDAVKTVVTPAGMLFYVDSKTLFERLYEKGKPMIAFSLLGSEIGKYFDIGKLPQATTISQHLAPTVVSYGSAGKGWIVEGTGPISVLGTYGLAGTVLFGVRKGIPLPPQKEPAVVTPVPGGR